MGEKVMTGRLYSKEEVKNILAKYKDEIVTDDTLTVVNAVKARPEFRTEAIKAISKRKYDIKTIKDKYLDDLRFKRRTHTGRKEEWENSNNKILKELLESEMKHLEDIMKAVKNKIKKH